MDDSQYCCSHIYDGRGRKLLLDQFDVAAIDIPEFAKAREQSLCSRAARWGVDVSNPRNAPTLVSLRVLWPNDCAADDHGDEVAALHSHPPIDTERVEP